MHYIARSSNVAVTGITETKLDNTVYDSEVTIGCYNIVRNDRNRKGRGVVCYIRNNICFNRKAGISDNIEKSKSKPISVGIIYSPPSQSQLLQQMITQSEALDLDNEMKVIRNFNTNLLFQDKYILNKLNEIKKLDKNLLPEIKIQRTLLNVWPEPIDRLSNQDN